MKKDGKKRVWFLLIFCTAVFAAFLVRLYWMQFTMADHYAKKLEQASQTSYTVRIPAARGSIVDRSGAALVQDDTVYDLALCVPAPPDTEMAQTLQTLKELDLGGKDVETQLAAFCSAVSAGELPLAENLTQAQCQSLLAAGLPQSGAVRLTARGTRTAVDGTLAPQLLGGPFQLFPQTEGRLRINLPGRQGSLQLLELAAHDAARLQGEGLHSRQRLLKGLHRLRAGRSIQAVQQGKGGIRPIHLIG